MNKWFWGVLVFCCLTINETTVSSILAITIGEDDVKASIEHSFQYFSLPSYLDSAIFRLIPYLLLASLAAFLGGYCSIHEKIAFWGH